MERLCKIRDIQRAVGRFKADFERAYGICLNEGMALCSLAKAGWLSSGELVELLGLTHSNTSKLPASVKGKGLVERSMGGGGDRRRMFFSLTEKGRETIERVSCGYADLPKLLRGLI